MRAQIVWVRFCWKASAMPVDRLIALNAEVKAFRDAVNKHVASEAKGR